MPLKVSGIVFATIITLISNVPIENDVNLSIIHINDFHARYEETNIDSGLCKTEYCIGGFSRMFATIQDMLKTKPNSILLNAGDNFEGTLWHNVHKGNVTHYFFNKLPFDAFTLGNHEFDEKIEGLVDFLKNLKSPVVVANIDPSNEPSVEGLFNKSVVIERNGLKVGIIGVLLSTIDQITDVGNLKLLDESESVNAEAERLIQEEGVFTNIVLSHCGYDVDQTIAKKSQSKIGLVVGGHSHTFLFNGEEPPGPDIPTGPYPTVVENIDGKTVLVVQASSNTKYLGNITINYNKDGDVVDYSGAPIFLEADLPQDDLINSELMTWKKKVDDLGNKIIGSTLVRLDHSRCSMAECLLGNLVTDAMVLAYTEGVKPGAWTNASFAIMHAGGLRSGIDVGSIFYNELVAALPFKNTVDIGYIEGACLKTILEGSVSTNSINLLQVSGMHVVFNLSEPQGSRVASIKIRCRECDIPMYEDLVPGKMYRIVLPSFLANGGFGFSSIPKSLKKRKTGRLDIDLLADFIKHRSPVFQEVQGRIVFV